VEAAAMTDREVLLNENCPCPKKECKIRGNCVLCVKSHLEHRKHVPVCMQDLLRPAVKPLTDLLEIKTEDE
jgi:hypothetical protein